MMICYFHLELLQSFLEHVCYLFQISCFLIFEGATEVIRARRSISWLDWNDLILLSYRNQSMLSWHRWMARLFFYLMRRFSLEYLKAEIFFESWDWRSPYEGWFGHVPLEWVQASWLSFYLLSARNLQKEKKKRKNPIDLNDFFFFFFSLCW